MPLRALTIDFWNTLVVAHTGGRARQAHRMQHLLAVAHSTRPGLDEAPVQAAYKTAYRTFIQIWETEHRTPTAHDLLTNMWQVLALDITPDQHDHMVTIFEDGLLHSPPVLTPGLEDALAWAARHYRLGIISDTMFSPGRVIKRLLDQYGVLHHFDAFVFSDEVGVAKPDVRAFTAAAEALDVAPAELAHIGDLRRTDITGAQQAGARGILYTGAHTDADPAPEPDLFLNHWDELPGLLSPRS